MIASRATALKAMFWAERRDDEQMTSAASISSGWSITHCSTCMPPSDPPIAAARRSMPRCASSARCTSTRSRTVNSGKVSPYGRPVAGSSDDGPVVPWQPPSRLAHTTKKRSVSTARPGPIRLSHQPRRSGSPWWPAACASPVRAWQMKTAFERSSLRVPYVSYATSTGPSRAPDSSTSGSSCVNRTTRRVSASPIPSAGVRVVRRAPPRPPSPS